MKDRATKHAERVMQGDIVAGKLHKAACNRHLKDLERQGTREFPYVWKPELSEDIINFGETLVISEGVKPEPVRLYGTQVFDLGVCMGWVNQDSIHRRFRERYKSIARQNGKSFENGIFGTYVGQCLPYSNAKLATVATKKKQARLVWEEISKFIMIDPDLSELFRIIDYKSEIWCYDTGNVIQALSREDGIAQGFRFLYASLDELNQMKNADIYNAIKNGQRAQPWGMLSAITTRGKMLRNFHYAYDKYCVSILEGGVSAEEVFVDIHCVDEEDDIFDPANFLKSNSVLCQTEHGMKTMQKDAAQAKEMGGTQLVEFMVYCQNIWPVGAVGDLFVTAKVLEQCKVQMDMESLRGCHCYAGIDLSSGGDLTTICLEIEYQIVGIEEPCYHLWSHSFMPRGRLEEHKKSDLVPYDMWRHRGLLTVTGGENDFKNDYKFIVVKFREVLEMFGLILDGIGYDPHNADGFLSDLEELGAPMLEIRQSARFLAEGTEDLRLLMKSGRYHFDCEDELLDWSFRNATIVQNSFKETKIDKHNKQLGERVDPVDAAVDARTARMKLAGSRFDYDKAMDQYMEAMGLDGKEGE